MISFIVNSKQSKVDVDPGYDV